VVSIGTPIDATNFGNRVCQDKRRGAAEAQSSLIVGSCGGTYEELKAKGVEFTQEPTEHFYGTDMGIRDPFGNNIRITQPAPLPWREPSPDEFTAPAYSS
jgi:Glyoxalase/Bleomycin resistance protein/Dioxygenase superfamily